VPYPVAIDPFTGLPKKKAPNPLAGFDPTNPQNTDRGADRGYTSTSALPGSLDVPGFTPDYRSLIANDPVFKQLQADISAGGAGDLVSRNAALNRLFVGFGSLPDVNGAAQSLGINDLGQAIDPATGQLAAENQFSTQARLGQAHADATRQIRQNLAARHALQSGELGYQVGRENTAYGAAQNDATQALLDAISGLNSQYVTNQRAGTAALNTGLGEATNRQIGLNPATGSAKAAYDDGLSQQWGQPVYRGPNGELYGVDGTPITGTPPAVTNQPPPFNPQQQATGGLPTAGPPVGSTTSAQVYAMLGRKMDPRFNF
jgi:hypothetical protein